MARKVAAPSALFSSRPTSTAKAATVPQMSRTPYSVNIMAAAANGSISMERVQAIRATAQSNVISGIYDLPSQFSAIYGIIGTAILPSQILGQIQQPDGSGAGLVQVEFDPSSINIGGSMTTTLTAETGNFTLAMPAGAIVPSTGLPLLVRGASAVVTVTIAMHHIGPNGLVGVLLLPQTLAPLPVSILTALNALIPPSAAGPTSAPALKTPLRTFKLGEGDSVCTQSFETLPAIDSYPYGIFCRLIEPQMSNAYPVQQVASGASSGSYNYYPSYGNGSTPEPGSPVDGSTTYVDRIPVEQPLDVEGFREGIAGLDPTGTTFTDGEPISVAGTLGLGYVLWMSQQWQFQGHGLGDLVYSVPLAPGEQQQIAVFERTDTSSVFESESFSDQETMSQQALSDTSTQATVNSAFNEFINGSSQFNNSASSDSGGVALGVAAIIPGIPMLVGAGGGYSSGSSSNQGSASSSLNGQRDYAQSAAQDMQSSAESQASARRNSNRTGMRLASASESEAVTTKVITNHNHTRALTLQYWEVQRIYNVTTAIDGLALACLVPLKMIQFMPAGQLLTIQDLATLDAQFGSRQAVLQRYANLIKHLDVLQKVVPRPLQYGLTLLSQFASDPSAVVDATGGVAEDVINFTVQGSFLPCDTVTVTARTKRNTRIGPVILSPTTTPATLPQDMFASQDDMLAYLLNLRQTGAVTLSGALALPPSLNRTDIVGFEITRSFQNLSYTLISPIMVAANALGLPIGVESNFWQSNAGSTDSSVVQLIQSALAAARDVTSRMTITLTPTIMEQALGGPQVTSFSARIQELNGGQTAASSMSAATASSIANAATQAYSQVQSVRGEIQGLGGQFAGLLSSGLTGLENALSAAAGDLSDIESLAGQAGQAASTAASEAASVAASETYANDALSGVILPPRPYPVPALQIAPSLRYSEILEIEKTALHVVRNTTAYSKAVWTALSAEERAILLDGYTIGVPAGGLTDASQMVPLLNCVQNRVLGFFGNSMILPFSIPQNVAESMEINPAKIQSALLAFQQAGFEPPQSTVALPTRGVLGEAVLGHCPSAEKIDLTRFWNWQDSPADTAPTISPVTLPTTGSSLTSGLTAPNSLGNIPPLINNVLQAPQPNTSLLQSMAQAAGSQQDFSSSLTGAAQLAGLMQNTQTALSNMVQNAANNANSARADTLKSVTNLSAQAMATIGNLMGSGLTGTSGTPAAGGATTPAGKGAPNAAGAPPAAGGQNAPAANNNPNAGSSAASAIFGTAAAGGGQKAQGGAATGAAAGAGGGVTITIQVPGSGAAPTVVQGGAAAPAAPAVPSAPATPTPPATP